VAAGTPSWVEANQRVVAAEIARVRLRIELHFAPEQDRVSLAGREQDAERAVAAAQEQLPSPSALTHLCRTFGLSRFEREILLLAAGPELDGSFASGWTPIDGRRNDPAPTFALALAALADPHWSAVTPRAPLRYWRLLELGSGPAVTSSPLRIDERILHFLAGIDEVDERLDGIVEPLSSSELLPSHEAAAIPIVRSWSDPDRQPPLVQLCGPDRAARISVAAAAASALRISVSSLRADAVPAASADQATMRRLCEREAALTGSALVLDCDSGDARMDDGALGAATRFAERYRGPMMLAAREPIGGLTRPSIRIDARKPETQEQRALWLSSLGSLGGELNGQIDAVVGQFDLSASAIEAAGAFAVANRSPDRESDIGPMLWEASRAQARPRLDDLAQRIDATATWDDLVLPEAHRRSLREMIAHARHRPTVYRDWGFLEKGSRGLGISALFSGPSGTGKTMAAEVLARELRLDVYRIDLSSVVSKYIGETEKNLRRVFDAAEDGGTILLFDEADALFGKRSEVKDSHDRYANIEVGYLLQRMEAYRGIAILTTNLKGALDAAFTRRIRFVVQFPFPDPAARAEIWRRIFPAAAPVDGVQPESLARLNITGGSIRNIALAGAFLAADAGESIRMTHLLQAARSEYAKLEKPLTDAEIGGWA
jgi:AAA+ superfamily predicted ATPase